MTDYTKLLTKERATKYLSGILLDPSETGKEIRVFNLLEEKGELTASIQIRNANDGRTITYGQVKFYPFLCQINVVLRDPSKLTKYTQQKHYAEFLQNEIRAMEISGNHEYTELQFVHDYNSFCEKVKQRKIKQAMEEYAEQILSEPTIQSENE